MAWLGPLMMGGMAIGSTGTALMNSTVNVAQSCKTLEDNEKAYAQACADLNIVLLNATKIKTELQEYVRLTRTQVDNLQTATSTLHNEYTNKQKIMERGIIFFCMGLIIMFLFKEAGLWEVFTTAIGLKSKKYRYVSEMFLAILTGLPFFFWVQNTKK